MNQNPSEESKAQSIDAKEVKTQVVLVVGEQLAQQHSLPQQSLSNQSNRKNSIMRSQSAPISYDEPETHRRNKGGIEKVFGNCLNQNYDLNQQEIKLFCDLKITCNILFSDELEEHNRLVAKLWYAFTQSEISLQELNNDKWKDFGFQNKNPRTDFRGAGVTGLKHLIDFVQKNNALVQEMIRPEHDFLFAIASINCSYFLMLYFHLLDHIQYDKDKNVICGRLPMKNFCIFLRQEDTQIFFDLHALMLKDLFNKWIQLRKSRKGVTILNFGEAKEAAMNKIKIAFDQRLYRNYQDFEQYYQRN